ncbi:MAG: hypothetical protein MI754_01070, partial [Chromatiales bacterium]|nr:hypothetical protein [Chromatiales bacterium]
MSEKTNSQTKDDAVEKSNPSEETAVHQQVEEYGGGHIKARHGRINGWLIVVYAALFLWALYYGYTYWGGLGPGLNY